MSLFVSKTVRIFSHTAHHSNAILKHIKKLLHPKKSCRRLHQLARSNSPITRKPSTWLDAGVSRTRTTYFRQVRSSHAHAYCTIVRNFFRLASLSTFLLLVFLFLFLFAAGCEIGQEDIMGEWDQIAAMFAFNGSSD